MTHRLDSAHPKMESALAQLSNLKPVQDLFGAWRAAGASADFCNGTARELVSLPVKLHEHDRLFGTDSEVRARRQALARTLRTAAKKLRLDDEARLLTVYALDDDPGPYRVEWLFARHARRPTLDRVLDEAAELLGNSRTFGTVKLPRDVILGVADILDRRRAIVEKHTSARPVWRHRVSDIAVIASQLTGCQITPGAVKKLLQRSPKGDKTSR